MITELLTLPAVVLLLGALILPVIPDRVRSSAFLLFPLAALILLWSLPEGDLVQAPFASFELHLLVVDSLSRIFGTIFALITLIGGIYALHLKDRGQQSAALAYAGGALGVTFAGDWFTLFIFWEIMAVASTWLIWARRTAETDRAGMRYLMAHIVGGGFLLTGILMHLNGGGSFLIGSLPYEFTFASVAMLLGISLNTAVPPLHAWLADAYPKATVTGAVFMCALTTKSAVYLMIRVFPGWELLIWVGVAMALYGTIYALLANDIRAILSYSIISQIGYMVAAIGIGTELALNGATAHAFNHIIYKSLLFMAAGAVIHATGRSRLTELGGLAGRMKAVVALYMVGAFSIAGAPLLNGFISKTMITEAAGEAHLEMVILLLLVATIGTFLHTGLKLPWFTWFGPSPESGTDTARSPEYPNQPAADEITVGPIPFNMKVAMGMGASLCILLGLFPGLLYGYLPWPTEFRPFSVYTVVEMVQILGLAFVGFWLLRNRLVVARAIPLDTDWFYRRPARLVNRLFVDFPSKVFGMAESRVNAVTERVADVSKNPLHHLLPSSPERPLQTDGFTSPTHWALSLILLSFIIASLVILIW